MGEEHDAADHHRNQADWVRRMGARVVVFEMLTPELAQTAMAERRASAADLGAALAWEARGWPDFEAYAGIFAAAAAQDALILGAELPREALSRAAEMGAAQVFDGTAAFGLETPLDPDEQAAREAEQAEAHCGLLPEDLLPGMVEVQRLRDAALAQAALDGLDETGGPVAIITGNGHARRDRGVPALLESARPDLRVLAIGQFTEPTGAAPFDARIVTPPPEGRDTDPCAALR